MPRKVLFVADPGIDTAFALALALNDPNLEVVGVMPTAGNVSADQATANVHTLLAAIAGTAGWLDKHAPKAPAGFGQVAAWAGVVAAGLLLPHGKPRRLFSEAGLVKALGDMVGEDGGLLSRCPAAQLDAIRLLTDLIAQEEAGDKLSTDELVMMVNAVIVGGTDTTRNPARTARGANTAGSARRGCRA